MTGKESIQTGHEKLIYDYECPYCGAKYKEEKAKE